jgi:hypothetical protein
MSEAVAPNLGGTLPPAVIMREFQEECEVMTNKSDFNVNCSFNNSLLATFNHLFCK